MKRRFEAAFRLFSAQSTSLRQLQAAMPDHVENSQLHEINKQWQVLSRAESDYRAVRLEYARRLLARSQP